MFFRISLSLRVQVTKVAEMIHLSTQKRPKNADLAFLLGFRKGGQLLFKWNGRVCIGRIVVDVAKHRNVPVRRRAGKRFWRLWEPVNDYVAEYLFAYGAVKAVIPAEGSDLAEGGEAGSDARLMKAVFPVPFNTSFCIFPAFLSLRLDCSSRGFRVTSDTNMRAPFEG